MQDTMLEKASRMLKTLADPTRLKILIALEEKEYSVSELCRHLQLEQSNMSHQLAVLKKERLVTSRRVGRSSLYAPCDHHIYTIIAQVKEHVEEI